MFFRQVQPLWPKLMTLNGIMTNILCYFTEFGIDGGNDVTVIQVRAILSVTEMYATESSFWQYMIYGDILNVTEID